MPVKGQRSYETVTEPWAEGDYVLTVDRFTTIKDEKYVKGDVLHLDEGEATRLGNGNSIALVGSLDGRRAQVSAVEDDDLRRTKMMLLDAEALEEKARRLRETAGEEGA